MPKPSMCYFFCMREHATTTEDEMDNLSDAMEAQALSDRAEILAAKATAAAEEATDAPMPGSGRHRGAAEAASRTAAHKARRAAAAMAEAAEAHERAAASAKAEEDEEWYEADVAAGRRRARVARPS